MANTLLSVNAQVIAIAHTACSLSAFLVAFVVAVSLHYKKIVQNEHWGYPDEWFPSVSATIGDRYPERSIFQILIALTAGPRFLLLFTDYLHLYKPGSNLPVFALISGIVRTVSCGGWVYVTSTDDHDFHDFAMISYIVLTIPWDASITLLSPKGSTIRRERKWTGIAFFSSLVPLIYLFIQHKVHHVAGAYSYYAYFEWSLIFLDILFDAWSIVDFKDLKIQVSPSHNDDEYFEANFKLVESKATAETKEKSIDEKLPAKASGISLLDGLVDLINHFIFWSVVTGFYVCVWFFPLWDLGITGYEVTAASTLSPFLLCIPGIERLFIANPKVARILCAGLGIGSYLLPDPMTRLLTVSGGVVFGCIALAVETSAYGRLNNADATRMYATLFSLGLVLSSLLKFAFWSENPIWPTMNSETGGWNMVGLVVGLVAAALTKLPPISLKREEPATKTASFALSSIGFGALFFSLLAMMTDTSTIILWTWDGYPVHGPTPVPYGAVSLAIQCLGAYLGFSLSSKKFLKIVTVLGVIGAVFLYKFRGWPGYIGGLLYITWISAMVPVCFSQISLFHRHTGSAFGISFLVALIISLMSIWVVAYAFVPYGPLLRERTDIVLGTSVVCILALLYNYTIPALSVNRVKPSLRKIGNICLLFALAGAIVGVERIPKEKPQPYHPDSRLLTTGIWTIHFGLDNDMWTSEHRMRDAVRDLELDVFGLLESDTERIVMGNRDLTERLAEELNMYADYGPGPNQHTWGCALLSKFPIMNSTHYLMPSPVGELACAIHATLDCYGTPVDVVVFHSGQEEDVEDRRQQTAKLAEIMGSSDRPMVLLSYLVTKPLEGNYNTHVSDISGMHDIDATDDDRWCEYILYKHMRRSGYARISRGTITDTEIQSGKFVIPEPGQEDNSYSQKIIDESNVPEDMRYPSMFYGEGVRGHHFHVFDEPRYFL